MGRLDGRVALVTGAARGQGRAFAAALAGEGAFVVLADICAPLDTVDYPLANRQDLDEAVAAVRAAGGAAEGAVLDVRDGAAVHALVGRIVAEHGRLDVLVANAAITSYRPAAELEEARWRDTIEVNLTGAFHCIRAVLPHMSAAGFGRIVAIGSGAGRAGMASLSHYSASKWGLIGLVKSVALEVAASGVTANVVCPTSVGTPMVFNEANFARRRPDLPAAGPDDLREQFAAMNPMGVPWLEPEDVARAVLFLVTDPGTISGTVLDVSLGGAASRTA
jgi:SDR family mycofactocin-dependent oxidoreductase